MEAIMKILFVANNRTALNGMVLLIDMIRMEDSNIIPVLLCQKSYYRTHDYQVINTENPKYEELKLGDKSFRRAKEFYNQNGKKLSVQLFSFIKKFIKLWLDDRKADKIFNNVKPDYLLISDDRVDGINLALIKSAKKKNILIIKVSSAEQPDYKNNGFMLRNYNTFLTVDSGRKDINNIQKKLGDYLLLSHDGQTRAFFPTYLALAMYLLKKLPMHPWVCGASFPDVVFAGSENEKRIINEENHKIKVYVTGLIEDSYITNKIKNKEVIKTDFDKKYGLRRDDKIVLLSMPQLPEHNMVDWDTHRYNMDILITAINNRYGHCFVSLHPKSRKEDYIYLEKNNTKIIDEKLRDIIVVVDEYICLDTSSTIHFAHQVGIQGYDLNTQLFFQRISQDSTIEMLGEKRCIKKENIINQCNIACELLNYAYLHVGKEGD